MTVDLKTGQSYAPRREDYCTKVAACDPGGECPLWWEFLERVTDGNQDLESYLQRVVGYCLTGLTSEHVLFFLYGTGANGKTVFINTIAGMMGDYAVTAAMEMFLASHGERHPTELAMLRGARLVVASETEDGRRWSEAKIKALTGGDKIAARFMRQDFFEFTPQFKLMIAGNHKPSLRSVDEAHAFQELREQIELLLRVFGLFQNVVLQDDFVARRSHFRAKNAVVAVHVRLRTAREKRVHGMAHQIKRYIIAIIGHTHYFICSLNS